MMGNVSKARPRTQSLPSGLHRPASQPFQKPAYLPAGEARPGGRDLERTPSWEFSCHECRACLQCSQRAGGATAPTRTSLAPIAGDAAELDGSAETMFEFYLSLSKRRFERAAQLLEQGPHSSGTEAMWATLCHAAFEDSNLEIAERCWKRLGGEARADFLRKKTGESGVASDRTSTAMEQQVRPEVGESSERAARSTTAEGSVASSTTTSTDDTVIMPEIHQHASASLGGLCMINSEGDRPGAGLTPRRKPAIPVFRKGMKYLPGMSRADVEV